jgi:hypothetical protein
MLLLAFVFAAVWFVTGSMAAHLPRLLESAGATPLQAIAAAAMVGPAQVAARLVEFFILRRSHPLVSARIAALLHPIGAVVFALIGPPAAAAFAIFYGAGNGLLTIARGTVPLAVFGPNVGYPCVGSALPRRLCGAALFACVPAAITPRRYRPVLTAGSRRHCQAGVASKRYRANGRA